MDVNLKLKNYLVPPGNGVFTVNTAKERKDILHQQIFGTAIPGKVSKCFTDSLADESNFTKPMILGICSDCGGGILRGANWGPLFIRKELYEAETGAEDFFDLGDIRVIPHLLHDKYLNSQTLKSCRSALFGDEDSQLCVSPLSISYDLISSIYEQRPAAKLLFFGGDHSVSFPVTKAYLESKKRSGIKTAIIHFDAHTDLLDQRLGIDYCFGSWAYHILEDLPDPSHLIQVGIRSSGKEKSHWESKFGVVQYWAQEIKNVGAGAIAESITTSLKSKGVEEIYISFDIDAIDSEYASKTGTPEDQGLEPHQAHQIIDKLCESFPLTGADIVEVAPFIEASQKSSLSKDMTIEIAGELARKFLEKLK